jgi:hypothetical protein
VCQAKNTWDTVDLCDEPDFVCATIERDNLPQPHPPTHDVIKVRRVVHIRQFGRLDREAKGALERVRALLSTDGRNTPDIEEECDSDYSSQAVETLPRHRSSLTSGHCHSCTVCGGKISILLVLYASRWSVSHRSFFVLHMKPVFLQTHSSATNVKPGTEP